MIGFKTKKKHWQIALACLLILLALLPFLPSYDSHTALDFEKAAFVNVVQIPILALAGPIISKSELTNIRVEYFKKYTGLLEKDYRLRSKVFKNIEWEAPWLSKQAHYFYGQEGPRDLGIPAESEGLANPLLLIYPDFNGWSIRSALKWNKELVLSQNLLSRNELKLSPELTSVILHLSKKEIIIVYKVSEFKKEVQSWLLEPLQLDQLSFTPVAYNASDLGYNWYQLSSKSRNLVAKSNQIREIYPSLQHRSNQDCGGLELGCNMRASLFQGNPIQVTGLPAQAIFNLWSEKPLSDESVTELTTPDVRVRIQFQ